MKGLARVYLFTILVTAGGICAPFFLYAGLVAAALESSTQATILAIRLLAVAWAGLCVGYAFAFGAALRGERRPGMLWAGIVGNGGTCFLLGATIVTGAWEPWESSVRWILLAAAVLTASVTGALLWYGLLFDRVFGGRPNSPTPERAASAPETAPTPSRVAGSSPATPAPAAAPPAEAAEESAAGLGVLLLRFGGGGRGSRSCRGRRGGGRRGR
ncbi:MAG: hypothetical protein V2J24_18410, partial [Pseudomonadales bacterium]|nr:hypothetical protein [Pseudomonadales bacterium]